MQYLYILHKTGTVPCDPARGSVSASARGNPTFIKGAQGVVGTI